MNKDQAELEARARRVAKNNGYLARKGSRRILSAHNLGGFMLIEESTNRLEAGERFDMSAEQVIEFFEKED